LPHGLAIDGGGNTWVADTGNRVLMFSTRIELLTTWDRYGTGPGELNAPLDIAIDAQGRVFVSDSSNRVQLFSNDGQFLGGWGSRGTAAGPFEDPVAVVLDGAGRVYVIERYGPRVQAFQLAPALDPA
jgi:DNA-binding beta-propeller fold protein YncE